MSISPRFLDEIKNRLTLSEVIGRRVRVIRAGRESKACCPFHREKSPSFTINDDKQFYHCFGCGAHGDVLGFVMQHDNLSFMDTVKMLAAEAGLQMPDIDPRAAEKAEKSRGLYELMEAASTWFSARLQDPAHADVLRYVEERGITEQARAEFKIGYAPADGQTLRVHLQKAGFSDAQMIEVGLLKPSTKGGAPYIFFRDRLMFPVSDRRGRVVAFGGRILPEHMRPPDKGDFKPPKYINTPDTPLFDKGKLLYAESLARGAVRTGHTVIVTEGYMDVIACHMAGFKGAVAPMGTALTEDQILSLWSMMGEDGDKMPVLCFDGDDAGRRAASRAAVRVLPLLKPGKGVRFAFLPDGADPDSLLRAEGRGGLQRILQTALSLFDFLWAVHTAGRNFDTPEARAGLNKDLNNEISAITDPDLQRHYKELIRNRISQAFFKPFQEKGARKTGGKPAPSMGVKLRPPPPAEAKTVLIEKGLLATILNHPALYADLDEEFGRFQISLPALAHLRGRIIAAFEEAEEGLESAALRHRLQVEGFGQILEEILCESLYTHFSFCRPAAAPDDILALWRAMRDGLLERAHRQEIRQGWQNLVEGGEEGDEDRLRGMVLARSLHDVEI